MAALIPNIRLLVLIDKTYFDLRKNAADYHPGPEMPSTADGPNQPLKSQLQETVLGCPLLTCLGPWESPSSIHVFESLSSAVLL